MIVPTPDHSSCGFVFAATGDLYIALARRAARSLRQIHPEAEIDLFTNIELDDPVFSQVHMLSESWFRPKMEALIRSRFDRTIYLDADIMVIADLSTVFDILDRFDLACSHGRFINNEASAILHTRALPDAFVPVNGGVLAVRKSPDTQALLETWQAQMKATGARFDQPVLRELLYDSDLRVWVLPPGYNLMSLHELKTWWGLFSAPRVLHASWLHRRREGPGDPMTPFSIEELVGRRGAARLGRLIAADRNLSPDTPETARVTHDPLQPAWVGALRARGHAMYHWLRHR